VIQKTRKNKQNVFQNFSVKNEQNKTLHNQMTLRIIL